MRIKFKSSFCGYVVFVITLFSISLLLNSCVDEYWPDIGAKYDELLVVDGSLSNEPGPYIVKLAMSSNIERPEYKPVSNYEVIISDNLGNSEVLKEIEKGTYQTSPDGIQGVIGRSYKLMIKSPSNNRYETEFEILKKPIEIDNVYSKVKYQTVAGYDHDLNGLQFYVDTKMADVDTNYILWRLEDSFEYNANYRAKYIYDKFRMQFLIPSDSLLTCWKTRKRKEIITASTKNLTEPIMLNMPLQFISTETKELSVRYSVLAKQYTLSYEAYDYWNKLIEIEDDVSWLYAIQPYPVLGNIRNITDDNEIVLGYFMVAGIDKKRIFVDKPDGLDWYYNTTCKLITEDLYELLNSMYYAWPLYLAAVYVGPGQYPALPGDQNCVDCRESGGVLKPPDFWNEK